VSKPLVIVESPTKVRTLKKYLGKDYNVEATVGHIKDLPPRELGIEIENGFEPEYTVIKGKDKVVARLKKAAGGAKEIYLAPDPDREGEAIAQHVADELSKNKGKGKYTFHRVLFHELTRNAILKAMQTPQPLDTNKYEAQQIRRILDRLVGYQVSPLLWRKVASGLSAGRVQSVAVRIICERERAIMAFESEEYWSITAHLSKDNGTVFPAVLKKKKNKNIVIPNEQTALEIKSELEQLDFLVDKVEKKRGKKNPPPPFNTSRMQQAAIKRLRFTAKKTMSVAQQLYEGVDLGPGEPVGLITYMRTDSARISNEAAEQALDFIGKEFGEKYRPSTPRIYKNRKKVQDAHEAIRPTSVENTPQRLAPHLTPDQHKLYTLIWKCFVASQMESAVYDKTAVGIKAGPYLFSASGSILVFDGFLVLYRDEETQDEENDEGQLPQLWENDPLDAKKIVPKQHFTQPPPRFSEASLVKEMEENGIGRPSTYATILSTIRDKNYVELAKGYFHPTEIGFIVNDLLISSFGKIFDVDFTAKLEDSLDKVETGQAKRQGVLEDFWKSFKDDLDKAGQDMVSLKGVGVGTGLVCPKSGHPLHIKVGKNGPFLACAGYPQCSFTSNFSRDEKGNIVIENRSEDEPTDKICEKCGRPLVKKQGRFGGFLACTGYPECKNTQSLVNGQAGQGTGVSCPVKGCKGEIVEKSSKRGKVFFGCNLFPKCDYAIWDRPIKKACPKCGFSFLVQKSSKKKGDYLACPQNECGYEEEQNDKS
jgi:DNA topoisomerase-1